jgi:SAM-dependent methyltransferase
MVHRLNSYKQLCTEFYDLDKPEAPAYALAYYFQLYDAEGGPALEVMCGSGRFLLPFAARGADIDGVDASPEMLAACRKALKQQSLSAALYQQFVEDLDLPRTYRYVFVPGGSFVLIPHADQANSLRQLARHMEPEALLALELHTPAQGNYFTSSGRTERRVTRPDGAQIVLTTQEDGSYRYDLVKDGAVLASEVETYGWNPRKRREFVAMLEAAGFRSVEAVRPYTATSATDDDGLVVYVCRRSA